MKPVHGQPGLLDTTMMINDTLLWRVHGIWHAETSEPGAWQPARWLGAFTYNQLLDIIHERQP